MTISKNDRDLISHFENVIYPKGLRSISLGSALTATAKKVRGKGKRTIAREKALKDYSGTDPREYLASILEDPENFDEHRYMAANALMPYTYARLTSAKIDADVNANVNVVELDKSGGRG